MNTAFLLILLHTLQCSLCCRQSSHRHTVRAATDIVQAYLVAEVDRRGVAAVLAADAYLQVGTHLAALLRRHLDKLPHTFAVQHLEGILGKYPSLYVLQKELAFGVVTRVAICRLREVVGTEGEEL